MLYRNVGGGRFADVSVASGITAASGTYSLGVSTLDFDDDGWVDLYVANDSSPSALYRNNRDGTLTDIGLQAGCAYSQDGRPQAGMGVAVGDYDRDGRVDIFKTNFAGDTSTLYANTGTGLCDDRTFAAGIGRNTRWLGWGVAFVDLDLDGLLDLFLVNGHVYPEVDQVKTEAGYRQPKVVYRNRGDGRFDDVTARLGPPVTVPRASRGAAFADFDNDGDVDVVVNNMHDVPELYRLDRTEPGALADPPPARRAVEPQRDRRACPRHGRRRHAGRRGARRRQLLLAERSARPRRPGRRGEGGSRRRALAERARGDVARRRGEPDRHADRGIGARLTDDAGSGRAPGADVQEDAVVERRLGARHGGDHGVARLLQRQPHRRRSGRR